MFSLISNWKDWWRMWSIRLSVLGTAVLIFFERFPDVAFSVWASIPDDLKSVLPVEFTKYLGYGLIAASWFARTIKQFKLIERSREYGAEALVGLGGTRQRDEGILPEGDQYIEPAGSESGSPDVLHGFRDRTENAVSAQRSEYGG
jgi:hypothetical protein